MGVHVELCPDHYYNATTGEISYRLRILSGEIRPTAEEVQTNTLETPPEAPKATVTEPIIVTTPLAGKFVNGERFVSADIEDL
jgi:hypothetical protein